MNRRNFLQTTGCLAIGFTLGNAHYAYPLPFQQNLPGSLRRNPKLNAWLQVLGDGRVRIFTGKLELGQGIRTAIGQVAAEELDLDMKQVEVIVADTLRTPDEGYTVGSGSIENSAMAVRYAAASARQKFLEIAAAKWGLPVASLTMANGKVATKNGDKAISLAELLDGKQLMGTVQPPVKLKEKSAYTIVGRPIPREDIGRMVRGEPVYLHNLRFPGMVHARIVRPPAYGAQLQQVDEAAIHKEVPGILKIVRKESFLGVIAADEYVAIQAQKACRAHTNWSGGSKLPAGQDLREYLKKLPAEADEVVVKGKVDLSPAAGYTVVHAEYYKPYIMHGSIGPSCSVAIYDKDVLHLWSHSQGVFPLRQTLSRMLNMPEEKIEVTGVPGSGCYGHNGSDDVSADAALLALAYPGKHVRVQWMREDEHGWEPYGSAMIMEISARLDSNGKISDWKYDLWSDTHGARPGGRPENLLAAQYMQTPQKRASWGHAGASRNSEPEYDIPNQQVYAHFFKGPLRVSSLRSLGAYGNVFAIESFMDELAVRAGKDPFDFRLMHLTDERSKAVITKLRQMIAGDSKATGTGIGMAYARYKNSASYCAVASKVKVDTSSGQVQVLKMWAVIDAGETINPDGLKNQTEGGMIQSASWTLQEEVKFDEQHITSLDWNSYPIFRLHQVPEVEVAVIDHPEAEAMGAGEAAQGPAGAAIANAVFAACGKRIRSLPLVKNLSV
jgi:CO/xanthine dehydrogenase Mo-binding subunit